MNRILTATLLLLSSLVAHAGDNMMEGTKKQICEWNYNKWTVAGYANRDMFEFDFQQAASTYGNFFRIFLLEGYNSSTVEEAYTRTMDRCMNYTRKQICYLYMYEYGDCHYELEPKDEEDVIEYQKARQISNSTNKSKPNRRRL